MADVPSTDTAQSALDFPPTVPSTANLLPSVSTPDPSQFFPSKQQEAQAKSALESAYKDEMGAAASARAQYEKRNQEYRSKMDEALAAEGAGINEFTQTQLQKPQLKETNLWEQFGSPGFIIAMLGSAFSALPMNSALQSGAAAMNAINQGNLADYNRHLEEWREHTKMVMERQKMEHDLYADIDHLATRNLEEYRIKATEIATRFNDKRALALIDADMWPELIQTRDAQWKAAQQLPDIMEKTTEAQALVNTLNKDPRWTQQTDPMGAMTDARRKIEEAKHPYNTRLGADLPLWNRAEQLFPDDLNAQADWVANKKAQSKPSRAGAPTKEKEIDAIKKEYQAAHPEASEEQAYTYAAKKAEEAHRVPTANERIKQESHVEQYTMAVDDLIPQAEGILRRHVGAAGAAGYATRAGETVSNIFGSNDTDRRQFESDIEQLRLMAPSLLLDRTGRPLSSEHEMIDKIIRGLNLGDTTANTLRALDEVKRRLTTLRGKAAERIGEEAPADSKPPPSTEPSWAAFPEVQ